MAAPSDCLFLSFSFYSPQTVHKITHEPSEVFKHIKINLIAHKINYYNKIVNNTNAFCYYKFCNFLEKKKINP